MDEKNKLSEEVHKQFNEDCALYYNLWAECGNPGFVMENKNDSDIFVLMDRSFYIHNGVAYDYFADREITEGYTSTYQESISIDGKVIYPYYSIFSPTNATKISDMAPFITLM